MALLARLVVLASLFAMSGCAGTVSSVFHRPITAHDFEANRLVTVTGERRLAFIVPEGSNLRMCAESLPEVSSAVAAASSANLKVVEEAEGGFSDAFKTALLQTFTRTEIAEVLRQVGWQACQAWAQGALTNVQYQQELTKIIDSGLRVIEIRATQGYPSQTHNTLDPALPSAGSAATGGETRPTAGAGQTAAAGPQGNQQGGESAQQKCPAGSPEGAKPPECKSK